MMTTKWMANKTTLTRETKDDVIIIIIHLLLLVLSVLIFVLFSGCIEMRIIPDFTSQILNNCQYSIRFFLKIHFFLYWLMFFISVTESVMFRAHRFS